MLIVGLQGSTTTIIMTITLMLVPMVVQEACTMTLMAGIYIIQSMCQIYDKTW